MFSLEHLIYFVIYLFKPGFSTRLHEDGDRSFFIFSAPYIEPSTAQLFNQGYLKE